MNKHLFRLVFNAARGQLMAVAEVASSHSGGKDASGTTTPASGQSLEQNMPLAPMDIAQAAIRNIVYAVALVAAPAWLSTSAWAQGAPATTIVVNKGAPTNQQPVVTTTASGVTQVNIQAAVGGVSRNRYTQFDVGSNGLILNNSPVNSKTQIGGWVAGNNNLAAGSAGIILNEVNSSNPSQLRGYIEVAGQKAEVVIANPSGIAVNGGGFINASGATLTTGVPQFSGNTLTGYQVGSGTITVSGTGLDTANTGITTLQAKNIILQGGVFANDLRVKADNSTGTPGAVAIDVAAIGGMYANKITILATGLGAGVNNAGSLQANSGSFTLSADGTLTNTGTINSTATTRINAQTVNNSTGGAIFGGSVGIAATTLNNAAATSTSTAPVIATRDAAGRVDLGVQTLNNQEGALIYSAGTLTIGGSLDGAGQATGRATSITNNSATIEAASHVNITTQTLANTYTSLSYRVEVDPTTPATTGSADCGTDCWHTWTDTYYRAVAIAEPNGAAVIRSGADIALNASTSATNSSSKILAAGNVTTSGATLDNRGIDLTSQVATKRAHSVTVTWMENGIGCGPLGIGCHSERRWRTDTSTELVARNQTIGPAVTQERTTVPSNTALPNSALFSASNNNRYLVETNPAFTNKQIWLSSDFMLSALSVDPDITQKRMGDGFYEQRLINEQVARLTGYARLANYSSDEQQYQALMTAGITMAAPLKLRVGIALTAAQVAQLTSDIVWLVQQEVTLKDGSKQKVLVPQVYAMTRSGDLSANGALLSGNVVNLNTTGNIRNSHASIQGRELVNLNADNVRNLAGRIEGKAVVLTATQDIENTGGAVIAQQALSANAGRDILVQTTTVDSTSGQAASPSKAAAASASLIGGSASNGLQTRSTNVSRVAGLYVTGEAGVLLASAGRDAALTGALLQSAGSTTVNAGRNLNLATVTTSASMDATRDADNYNRSSRSAEVGSKLQSAGSTTLTAGQNITARAADVQAQTSLNVAAGSNVTIEAGVATSSVSSASKTSNSGFMSSSSCTERSSKSSTEAIASNFGGNTVTVTSGQDIGVKASNVVADKDVKLAAAGNVRIEAGTNTQSQSSYSAMSESGLMSSGGLDVSIGTRDQSTDQKNTRTSAAASTVGSTGGNISITAGKAYTQTGSDVLASGVAADGTRIPGAGNIDITAKKVDIVDARETSNSETKTKFEQSGITLALSNPVVSAAQTMQKMAAASENTKSDRMKALAVASAALAAKSAAPEVSKLLNGKGSSQDISVSLSVGSSSSESTSTSTSNTARGSSVTAGGTTTIRATGDGPNSNLTIQGSSVESGDTTNLSADNKVLLLAAANTATQTSDQKSSSGSVGVTLGKNTGVTVSAAQGSGDGNGQDVYYTNTRVQGGKVVNIQSGGDTTLKGAVVKADVVNATVGGNLSIESLQDSSRYKESSQNASGSVTVGAGAGGNISAGATNINSNYLSVTEQSGIRAGDGGFNVKVQGNTDLKAGAITSTQKAVEDNKNTFTTAKLTTSDLHNSASYSAESYQVSVGTSGGSAGAGQDSGQASSTTLAAISGVAGNKAARTGDAETGIKKIFDQAAVTKDINAQVQITNEFGSQSSAAWGSFANKKFEQALKSGDEDGMRCWGPDGSCRAGGHMVLGGLTGGANGAVAAGSSSVAAPHVQAFLIDQGVPPTAASAITQLAAMSGGAAIGGVNGASAATNEAGNNAVVAIPLIVEGVIAGGAMAARACLSSPACLNTLRLGGATLVAKVAVLLTPNELAQIPGFGSSTPLPPAAPTITPADARKIYGSPPLNDQRQLSAWLGNVLDGYPADEAAKWAKDFITTLPASQQQSMSDLIMQSVQDNAVAGSRREREVTVDLQAKYPNGSVQNQQYLRDKNGDIVIDPNTGTARRLDHVVIVGGQVVDVVETTSLTADKRDQIRHEIETRKAGGTYVRDRESGKLIKVSSVSRVERKP